jgi:hypothetical protein
MAQEIVKLYGPFGKYHVMNCADDCYKVEKNNLFFIFCFSFWIVNITLSLYVNLRSVFSRSLPSDADNTYNADNADNLHEQYKQAEAELEIEDEETIFKIPTFEELSELYQKIYKETNKKPKVIQQTGKTSCTRIYKFRDQELVLPAIQPPSDEEYATRFMNINIDLQQEYESELLDSEIDNLTSELTFHSLEIDYATTLQDQRTLFENFLRKIFLQGEDIVYEIQETVISNKVPMTV